MTGLVWLSWTYLASHTNQAQLERELETKKNLVESQLKQLNVTEERKDQLEKEKVELTKQLQAKREKQAKDKVYAAVAPKVSTSGNCATWMAQAGIPSTAATNKLIINESGCRTGAVNPTSGACGIPQAYPCAKLKCALNDSGAVCQLQWMDAYVKGRYGSWENALSAWYSRCGSPQGCWY